jgi:ABC-type Fe3+ transport system substrate-binding protein
MMAARATVSSSLRIAAALAAVAAVLGSTSARALTAAEILNYKGPDRQQVLEDGARKEGTVFIYSGMIVSQLLRPLTEAFAKKYPFIKTRYWRGDSNQVLVKVISEMQANALEADLVEGSGLGSFAVAGGKIVQPFYSPMFDALRAEDIAPDRTSAATRFRYIGLGYNTNYISAGDAPRNYEDLLDPRWKRRMAWHTGSDASGALVTITTLLATWGVERTQSYLAKLARQDIAPLAVSNRQVVDQVILGEYWIGLGISAHHPVISASRGAPAATVLLDPIPSLSDSIQVLNGAKHPHAAMLFVDFILSAPAQRMMQAADYFPSNPSVELSPNLKMIVPRNAGIPELMLTSERLGELTPQSVALYQRYFR